MKYNFVDSKPQINQDILKSIESYFNIKLPNTYKDYLLEVNGGISKRNIFFFKNGENGSVTHHWYGIRSEPYFSLLSSMYERGIRYPNNFIAICDDSFGNKVLLSIRGSDYGKLYFWDHERESYEGEKPDYSNLTLIADSFEEFINNLKSEEDS